MNTCAEKLPDSQRFLLTTNNEDVQVEFRVIDTMFPTRTDLKVMQIVGGGDNVLALLAHERVASVLGIDMNPLQIHLLNLKLAVAVSSLTESEAKKAPWRQRKEEHLHHLAKADKDLLIVAAADKLHNARAIATDLQTIGESVWDRFNSDKESIIWYYEAMLEILERAEISEVLLNPLKTAVAIMNNPLVVELTSSLDLVVCAIPISTPCSLPMPIPFSMPITSPS